MPVPSTIADLSTIAADNSPHGSESIGTSLDDYLRTCFAFIRQVNDASNFISTSPTYSSNANLAPIVNSIGTGWLYKTAAQFLSWLGLGVANAASGVVVLDSSSRLPAVSGALLTGINIGVSSVNGNTGEITAEQIAAAATAGYGYTPADSAHTHSGYVSTNMTHGAVGSLCFARLFPTATSTITLAAGATVAGSELLPAGGKSGTSSYFVASGAALAGTWRCLGYADARNSSVSDSTSAFSLFQRIS